MMKDLKNEENSDVDEAFDVEEEEEEYFSKLR